MKIRCNKVAVKNTNNAPKTSDTLGFKIIPTVSRYLKPTGEPNETNHEDGKLSTKE